MASEKNKTYRETILASTSLGRMMVVASVVAVVEIVGGLAVAYETDSPARAVIVLGSAAVYLLALAAKHLRGRVSPPASSFSHSVPVLCNPKEKAHE
ncbi:MAG: metal ABC transporter permease [Ferruginibacter sp.]